MIIQRTVLSDFEAKFLHKDNTHQLISKGSSILANIFNNEFFSQLSANADKEDSRENQNLDANRQKFQKAQLKIDCLKSHQALYVLDLYNTQGVWAAINYILLLP